jgi:Flp pilus assembly protein CpaB
MSKIRKGVAAGLAVAALACAGWAAGETAPAKAEKAALAAGYRAISMPMPGSELTFVKAGDRVDVIVTFDTVLGDKKEKVTATLLQNVLVSRVKQPEKPEEKGVVQLVVNPAEAQYVWLGYYQGNLQLALRAPGDVHMEPIEMSSFKKLFR